MPNVTQYTSATVEFTFTAYYTGDELIDEEFDSLTINDVPYDYGELIEGFGQHGADAIVQIGRVGVHDDGWAHNNGLGYV